MSNYTKGPWIVKEQPVKHHGFYIQQDGFIESQRAFIGEAGGGTQPTEEIEANAKLIAAAPDLLEALVALKDYCKYHEIFLGSGIIHQIDVAIDKAVKP